jgi:hypothetical protein
MPKTLSDLYFTNVAHEFYHRHRRAVLTIARFSRLPLSVVNAHLCWG